MPFVPWGVGDLRDDRLKALRPGIEAVIKADRVERKPEMSQMREESDRPIRGMSGFSPDVVPDSCPQRDSGIAQIVPSLKSDRCRALR